jgi:hypothetical protein
LTTLSWVLKKKVFLLGKSLNLNFSSLILSAFLNIKVNSNLSCPDDYLSIKTTKAYCRKFKVVINTARKITKGRYQPLIMMEKAIVKKLKIKRFE